MRKSCSNNSLAPYLVNTENKWDEKKVLFVLRRLGFGTDINKLSELVNYSPSDLIDKIIDDAEREDCQIIMTEKDYFKFEGYKADRINFLSVKLHINNKEKLLNRIKDLYDKDI